MAKCECSSLAYECGYNEALFDGIESELECYCMECQYEYQKGWIASEAELWKEIYNDPRHG